MEVYIYYAYKNGDLMNNKIKTLFLALLIVLSLVVTPAIATQNNDEKVPVLIMFKEKKNAELIKANGGDIKYEYTIVPAIAAKLSPQAISALCKNPNIELIEADGIAMITGESIPWGINRVNAPDTQALGISGSGIKVAIIDSGVDYNHPDLAANYLGGYDFVNNDADPMDDHGHGTHVAGTIATLDNDIGVLGVAPEAGFYALKAADSSGSCSMSDVAAAVDWAVSNDVDVISMSLGGSYSYVLKAACDKAYNNGVVLVAAAGNTGSNIVLYPAAYDSVIAVSATDSNNIRPSWSTYGPQVELAAPGVSVYSTIPGSSYGYKSGTSMATPHVTGSVALLLSTEVSGTQFDLDNDGTWDPAEVRARLQSTATDLGVTGKDDYYGYGLVNAYAAVSNLKPAPATEEPATEEPVDDTNDTPAQDPVTDPAVTMYLSALTVDTTYSVKANKHVFAYATAKATVVDADGNPVSGATVSGDWSGLVSGAISGITDSNGMVTFQSTQLKNPSGSFVFTVTDIALDGYVYDQADNSCDESASALFTFAR